ncbi:MAG: RdgB/HAM1 family non-canonical purine NTP pyrophosphatase [Candidatus Nitrosopumilus sp. bin_32a]
MRKSFDLFFVSSNNHKYQEAKIILNSLGINLGFLKSNLEEIQSNSLDAIAMTKARDAFSKFKKPVIVEDDGLFIDSIDGFPGPYSSYVFKTIGNRGILDLLKNKRKAKFVSIITYCDKTILQSFEGKLNGKISKTQKGKGWGYDPIFIPNNSVKTFAEMNDKNELSHRYKALKKFSKWYLRKLE